jgi:hypothetical protein
MGPTGKISEARAQRVAILLPPRPQPSSPKRPSGTFRRSHCLSPSSLSFLSLVISLSHPTAKESSAHPRPHTASLRSFCEPVLRARIESRRAPGSRYGGSLCSCCSFASRSGCSWGRGERSIPPGFGGKVQMNLWAVDSLWLVICSISADRLLDSAARMVITTRFYKLRFLSSLMFASSL